MLFFVRYIIEYNAAAGPAIPSQRPPRPPLPLSFNRIKLESRRTFDQNHPEYWKFEKFQVAENLLNKAMNKMLRDGTLHI
jgi:hypothetical protein